LTIQKQELPMATMFIDGSDRVEVSNLYRESSIDASYQVSVYLAKRFRGEDFLNIDQPKTRFAYGNHVC
jgi:hypothetical protein